MFADTFKFGECLFIVKGILFEPPWILGTVVLVKHCLVVECLDICAPHIVVAPEEVMPSLHAIMLGFMSLYDCLCCFALAYLFQRTIECTVLFFQNNQDYFQVRVP